MIALTLAAALAKSPVQLGIGVPTAGTKPHETCTMTSERHRGRVRDEVTAGDAQLGLTCRPRATGGLEICLRVGGDPWPLAQPAVLACRVGRTDVHVLAHRNGRDPDWLPGQPVTLTDVASTPDTWSVHRLRSVPIGTVGLDDEHLPIRCRVDGERLSVWVQGGATEGGCTLRYPNGAVVTSPVAVSWIDPAPYWALLGDEG